MIFDQSDDWDQTKIYSNPKPIIGSDTARNEDLIHSSQHSLTHADSSETTTMWNNAESDRRLLTEEDGNEEEAEGNHAGGCIGARGKYGRLMDTWNWTFSSEVSEKDSTKETPQKEDRPKARCGRHTKPESLLLRHFQKLRKSTSQGQTLKKEYLRVSLIRAFKRSIRQVYDSINPRNKMYALARKKWKQFCDFVFEHDNLLEIASTGAGPRTDGKSAHNEGKLAHYLTHSDAFCRSLFKSEIVREAFRRFLDILFNREDPKALEKQFNFKAVEGKDGLTQEEMWGRLKNFLYWGMFQGLGLPEHDEWAKSRKLNLHKT